MAKIDIEQLICHILQCNGADTIKEDGSVGIETADLLNALHAQGLYYRNGKLKEAECPFKNGDVLVDKNHGESVCIFRKILVDDDGDCFSAYCGTQVGSGRFCTSDDEEVWADIDEMELASDEQRKYLFGKMKENGYGFDFRQNKLLHVPKAIMQKDESVAIEIGGERHILTDIKGTDVCESCFVCSLTNICDRFKNALCDTISGHDGNHIFQKEE